MDSPQYLVRKVETCRECDGEGIFSNLNWQEINAANNAWMEANGITTFTEEAQADWERRIKETWPHSKPPPEEEPCCECEGAGKVEKWIDLRQALIEIGAMDLLHAPETRRKLDHIQDALNQTLRNLERAQIYANLRVGK